MGLKGVCAVWAVLATAMAVPAAAMEDALQQRLDAVVDAYNKSATQETDAIESFIKRKIDAAQGAGELDLKKALEACLGTLRDGRPPTHPLLHRVIDKAGDDLDRAWQRLLHEYEKVVKEYVRQGDDERAEDARAEAVHLDAGRPGRSPLQSIERPLVSAYLADLPETAFRVVHFGFGKGIINGKPIRSIVDHRESPHGLSMHPGDKRGANNGECFVTYDLPPGATRFIAMTTLDEKAVPVHCGVQFAVVVNGKEIWASKVISAETLSDTCDIPLPKDTRKLELRTRAPGPAHSGHAVWIEPRLKIDPALGDSFAKKMSHQANRAAAKWVLAKGGTVTVKHGDGKKTDATVVDQLPAGDFTVTRVTLRGKKTLDDHGLRLFSFLKELEYLYVGGSNVSDALCGHLKLLPRLRSLHVNWTGVTGKGLSTFEKPSIRVLDMGGMKDADEAIAYLHEQGVITEINLDRVHLSPKSLELLGQMTTLGLIRHCPQEYRAALKEALPGCRFQ